VVACIRACDIEQVALGIIDLLEVGFVGDVLDALRY